MRLIDADALKLDIMCVYGSNPQYINWLNHAPTVDAVPVVHGEWLPIIEVNEYGEPYQSGVYCSECGETSIYEPNYCPNCGARMDEEGDSDHAEEEIL